MESSYLENIWNTIVYQGKSDFEFKRLDITCIPELSIGFNSKLNRCLILELPLKNNVDFQSSLKENLSIQFFRDTNYIVIELIGTNFYDLFNDLIISLYHRIKAMTNADLYAGELINTYYKWSEFFSDIKSDRLSIDIIKGIFGELIVLKNLLYDSKAANINDILNSWVGPYDKGHDFELDAKDLEVKTKEVSKLDIRISSEYQLEAPIGKQLELVVVSVILDAIEGVSIRELFTEIKNFVISKLGDGLILVKAINQKGLVPNKLHIYDNFRFNPITQYSYSCCHNDFPKLIKTNIPKEITGVSYNIRISELNQFLINKIDF
jgi:predicted cupin superfamily sugar epimerase